MDTFLINGGKALNGSLEISTAKNAVLPILAGCILCEGKVVIHKFPFYEDTKNMLRLLEMLGAKTYINGKDVEIDCLSINKTDIPQDIAGKLRSSVFCLGAILSRFKKAKVPYPGGCAIGARPIDLHIKGLETLNVKVIDRHGFLNCDGSQMTAGVYNLDFPSVGATENIMLAGCLLKGKTKIINAAKEPEIVDLQNFLNSMGARVTGAGTSEIEIEGVERLTSTEYTPISDRIITGTYLIASVMCGGKVELSNVNPTHISSLIAKLKNNGCKIKVYSDKIIVANEKRPKSLSRIETMPYPGFPTDLQPQIVALSAISKGTTIVAENVFESRFKHIPELVKMGADITIKERVAVIKGVKELYGAEVSSTDLRSGASLVLAGLVAKGYTKVLKVEHIDRGYEHIELDLLKLGASIERITQT